MGADLVPLLLPLLLGGGLITALVTLYRAKKTVPVERDSIIVTGAQGAVLALEKSLQAETARADRCSAEVEELRKDLADLERKLNNAQGTILALQATLDDMRQQMSAITKNVSR